MCGGAVNFRFLQLPGNLGRSIAIYTQCKNLTHNCCGFFIHNPMPLGIFGVFHIAVWRSGSQIFSGLTLLLHGSPNLLAAVFDIELIDDVQKRCEIVVLLVGTINTAVHSNETHIVLGKEHFRIKADFQIVSSDSAHVFCKQDFNLISFHKRNHALPVRSVEVGAGIAVIYEELNVAKSLFLCVFT